MSILLFFFSFLIGGINTRECYYDGNDFCVSDEDILSIDLLPGTFFLDLLNNSKDTSAENKKDNETINGSYEEAFYKMTYHR